MRSISFLLSFGLLLSYGLICFWLFSPININDYHTPESVIFNEYDYIVVGAGSAGSVVASRLAQNDFTVLLLESGVSDYLTEVSMPAGFLSILALDKLRYLIWGNSAILERDHIRNEIDIPRAKMVGGCGSINGMIWNIGNQKVYDKWDQAGAKGWKWSEIKQYFERAENTMWIDKGTRSVHQSLIDILDEAQKMYNFTSSFNEKSKGFNFYETSMRNGRRWSSSDAYLKPTLRKFSKNFHFRLNSTVQKVLFNEDKNRAVGVQLEGGRIFKAKREVIISAGAINSPLLLLKSGIGNSTELQEIGIKTVKNVPGVGKNFHDHPTTSIIYAMNDTKWVSLENEPPSLSRLVDYFVFGKGAFTSNVAELGGYIRTKYAQYRDIEDMQFHCLPLFYGNSELMNEKKIDNRQDNFVSCLVTIVTPRDRGAINLKSAFDANSKPEIKINFLETEEDMNTIIEGMKAIDAIFQAEKFRKKSELYLPKRSELGDREKLKKYIYKSLIEAYHPVGTCKMGDTLKDEKAVVDQNLIVRGFENLRVIDASIFPIIPNSNTNAPTIMVAEKGADLIIKKSKL